MRSKSNIFWIIAGFIITLLSGLSSTFADGLNDYPKPAMLYPYVNNTNKVEYPYCQINPAQPALWWHILNINTRPSLNNYSCLQSNYKKYDFVASLYLKLGDNYEFGSPILDELPYNDNDSLVIKYSITWQCRYSNSVVPVIKNSNLLVKISKSGIIHFNIDTLMGTYNSDDYVTISVTNCTVDSIINITGSLLPNYKENVTQNIVLGLSIDLNERLSPKGNTDLIFVKYYPIENEPPQTPSYYFSNYIENSKLQPVRLTWEINESCTADSVPMYQVQILKIYNYDPVTSFGGSGPLKRPTSLTVDWGKAINVYTSNYKRYIDIPLTEGEGYYIWRVRPIGNLYPNGAADDRNWGEWAKVKVDNSVSAYPYSENRVYSDISAYYLIYVKKDPQSQINWVHNRTFTDDASGGTKQFDQIEHMDNLLKVRQAQVRKVSDNSTIIAQSYYDYLGRNTITPLPYPERDLILPEGSDPNTEKTTGLNYKNTGIPFDLFSPYIYDPDNRFQTKLTIPQITTGRMKEYYDGDYSFSNFPEINDKLMKIPSANGYPYVKTTFKEDGTNRVLETTILGGAVFNNTTPPQNRKTKYYYSTVTRDELFGILDDQTPTETELTKTYVKDPNGVVTVTYYDPNNKPIASCIDKTSATDVLDTINHQYVNFSQKDIWYVIDRYVQKSSTVFSDAKVFVDTKDNEVHEIIFEDNLDSLQLNNHVSIECMALNFPFYIPYTVRLSITDDFTLDAAGENKYNFLPAGYPGNNNEIEHTSLNPVFQTYTSSINQLFDGSYTAKREVEFFKEAALNNIMTQVNPSINSYLTNSFQDIDGYIDSYFEDGKIDMNDAKLAEFYELLDTDNNWSKYPANSSLADHNIDYFYKITNCTDTIRVPYKFCGIRCELPTEDYEQYLKDQWKDLMHIISPNFKDKTLNYDTANIDSYFYYHDKTSNSEKQLYKGYPLNGQTNANGAFNLLIYHMLNDEAIYHDNVKFKYSKDTVCDCWKKTVDIGLELAFSRDENDGSWYPTPRYNLLEEFLNCTGRKISGFALPDNPYDSTTIGSEPFLPNEKFGFGYLAYAYKSFKYDAFNENNKTCEIALGYPNFIGKKTIIVDGEPVEQDAVFPYRYNLDYLKWSEFYLCQAGEAEKTKTLEAIETQIASAKSKEAMFNEDGFVAADKSTMPECILQAIKTGEIIDLTCVAQYKQALESKCHLRCDSLGFRQRLVDQIHQEGGYIEGEPFCQGNEIVISSIQFLPVGSPTRVRMNSLESEIVELSINKYFTLVELNNYVAALLANCDCNCTLTQNTAVPPASKNERPYANLIALGNKSEWHNYNKIMSWDYDVKIRKLYDSDTLSANPCVDDSLYSCGAELVLEKYPKPYGPSDWEWQKLIADPSGNNFISEKSIFDYLALRLNRRLDTLKAHLANLSYTDAYLFADTVYRKNNCAELKDEFLSAMEVISDNVYNISFPYLPTLDYTQGIIYLQTDGSDLQIPFVNPIANSLGGILLTTARGLSYDFKNTTGLHEAEGDTVGIRNDEWTFFPKERFLNVYGTNVNSDCDLDTLLMKYDDKFIVEKDSSGHYCLYLERTWTYDDNQDTASVRFAPYRSKLKFLRGSIGMDLCKSLCFRWRPPFLLEKRYDLVTCGGNFFQDIIVSITDQYNRLKDKYNKIVYHQVDNIFNKLIEDAKRDTKGRFSVKKTIGYTAYTLYYYDRGGNLQYTVPPEGVRLNAAGRHHFVSNEIHTMAGKLLSKQTPEEETGREIFIYDKYNRLRFSQNAKQRLTKLFTYIKYDRQGRIIENGEIIDSQDSLIPSRLDNYKFYSDNWPNDGTLRTGYVRNAYDMPCEPRYNNQLDGVELTSDYKQRNVRNKLSYATRYNPITPGVAQPSAVGGASMWRPVTTVYSYDAMGHVEFVLQVISRDPLGAPNNPPNYNKYVTSEGIVYNPKYVTGSMHYQYDYVSGNINMIIYNKFNSSDEDLYVNGMTLAQAKSKITNRSKFYEKFEYDEDNRLVAVFSSRDSIIWEKDARYEFYPHGPVFRNEIGTDGLTLNEYTYTIEGWQKSMNGNPRFATVVATNSDGLKMSSYRPFGYVLNYYSGDFMHSDSRGMPQNLTKDLFNGAIRTAEFSFWNPMGNSKLSRVSSELPARFTYDYDLLYRLTKSTFSNALDLTGWGDNTENFKTTLRYDLSGNILNQTNTSYDASQKYNFRYRSGYTARLDSEATNKLHNIYNVSNNLPVTDYFYDEIGNLKTEMNRTVSPAKAINILWTYDKKLLQVERNLNPSVALCGTNQILYKSKVKIQYLYDASGNRVAEIMNSPEVINLIGEEDSCTDCIKSLDLTNKYYIRRENGDIMSVYEAKIQKRKDAPINYRSPEMPGVKQNNRVTHYMGSTDCSTISVLRQVEWDIYAGAKDGMLATATPDTMTQIQHFYRPIGWKTYEMKDWLGTPRLTFSDIKQPDVLNNTYSDYTYHLDYLSATTTYPFGARIDSLSFEKPSFRFGFTGHLKDNNIRPDKGDGANYSTLFREYDPIIGRWWSIDPLRAKYAGMSPYNYAVNNPINSVDPQGAEPTKEEKPNGPAWKHTNEWNDKWVSLYRDFVKEHGDDYREKDRNLTCEDLGLSSLIDFARGNGLPIKITNGSGTFDSRDSRWGFERDNDFKNKVLTTTAARDLQNSKNTLTTSLSELKPGDIMLQVHDNKKERGIAHHVQLVTQKNNKSITIEQGDFVPKGPYSINRSFRTTYPLSVIYIGGEITQGRFNLQNDTYTNNKNNITKNNFLKEFDLKSWNFNNFNEK